MAVDTRKVPRSFEPLRTWRSMSREARREAVAVALLWVWIFNPEFEGIWTRYIENGERPLEQLVQEAADNAQKCLDERYAENP